MTFTILSSYKNSKYRCKYSREKYKDILFTFFYELSKAIIYDKYEYKLPFGGGIIRIAKSKPKKSKSFDFGYYKKTGEKRLILNRHTNGYYFFWYWNKKMCRYKNYKLYDLQSNRGNDYVIGARGLSKHIKQCSEDPYRKDYDVISL